jgi:hypothetical protein
MGARALNSGKGGGMIKAETAANIARAYREIDQGQKLLSEVDEQIAKATERVSFHGEVETIVRPCQLGWPDGNGYRLYSVEPQIARAVIVAHLADQQAKLEKLNEIARLELMSEDNHG